MDLYLNCQKQEQDVSPEDFAKIEETDLMG
jgi:hypothetical protein